jgi:hypothetical protein
MTQYELNANGDRVSTRFAPGYFQMMTDFVLNGRLDGRYENSKITQPDRKPRGR